MINKIIERKKLGEHGFMMRYSDGHQEYFIGNEWLNPKFAINNEHLKLTYPDMLNDMVIYLVHRL